jgi:hypothetical protein
MILCMGSRGIAPLILNFGTRWIYSTSHPGCLTSGKLPRYCMSRSLGRLQSWSGHLGEEKSLSPLLAFELRTVQSVALLGLYSENVKKANIIIGALTRQIYPNQPNRLFPFQWLTICTLSIYLEIRSILIYI